MNSLDGLSLVFGAMALLAVGGCFILQLAGRHRLHQLRKEVRQISEDMLQLVELQTDIYRRMCRGITDVEEKVLGLAVPSGEAPPPLERRHQVLTLARNGMGVDEIARRLGMPKGEAELILSLRRYAESKTDGSRPQAPTRHAGSGALARGPAAPPHVCPVG